MAEGYKNVHRNHLVYYTFLICSSVHLLPHATHASLSQRFFWKWHIQSVKEQCSYVQRLTRLTVCITAIDTIVSIWVFVWKSVLLFKILYLNSTNVSSTNNWTNSTYNNISCIFYTFIFLYLSYIHTYIYCLPCISNTLHQSNQSIINTKRWCSNKD